MFSQEDIADFIELIEETGHEFRHEDGVQPQSTFKAAIEDKPAGIGSVFGKDYAENYSISGRTAMLYLKPDTELTPNDIISVVRTSKRWQVHDVTEAAFPEPVIRFALISFAPM